MNTQFKLTTMFMLAMSMIMIGVAAVVSMLMRGNDTQTATDAVYTAIMKASDNDARNQRGVFAIHKNDFEYYMRHSSIKTWQDTKTATLRFKYFEDTSANAKAFMDTVSDKSDVTPILAVKVLLVDKNDKTLGSVNYVVSKNVSNKGAKGIDATDSNAVSAYRAKLPA